MTALQVVVDLGVVPSDTAAAELESNLSDLIGTAYLARALDAGDRDGLLDQWLSFRRLVRRMEHARSPAGRPHDTPTPEAIERAMRRQRSIMRDEAVVGLVVIRRYVDRRLELTAAYRSGPVRAGAAALVGARRVIEMIIAWQVAHDGAGRERQGLGRDEAQRMADVIGPTHPRASAQHFAALDDGRAVTAVMALADHQILSSDILIRSTSPHSGAPFDMKAQVR
jgi:hypothetical protein